MSDLVFEAHGVRYAVRHDVYDPSDDTFLLMKVVRGLRPGRLLDIGTGAGLVAIAAAQEGHEVVATDMNPHALLLTRENARRNGVHVGIVRADLLRGIRGDRFDAIAFNAPYLPTSPGDHVPGSLNLAFDGGPDGLRATTTLAWQLPRGPPPLFVVGSTLQPDAGWARMLDRSGCTAKDVATAQLPHEILFVRRIDRTRKD